MRRNSPLTLDEVIRRTDARKVGSAWQGLCPAHPDRNPSLSIRQGDTQEVVLYCHSGGCSFEAITAALSDDSPPQRPQRSNAKAGPGRVSATHVYRTIHGDRVEIDRVEHEADPGTKRKKDFIAYHLDASGRRTACKGCKHALQLYREEEMRAAGPSAIVWVVEGEKKADLLRSLGLVAISRRGGARQRWEPHHVAAIGGRRVAILPDFNKVGRDYAESTLDAVRNAAKAAAIVVPPGVDQGAFDEEEDIEQWLESGLELSQLLARAENLLDMAAMEAPAPGSERDVKITTMADVDLEEVEWIWYGRLARGKLTLFDGAPEQGKSFISLDLAARISTGRPMPNDAERREPAGVLMMSCEDGLGDTVRPRLEAAGADLTRIHHFTATRTAKDGSVDPTIQDVGKIEREIRRFGVQLLIVDPLAAYWGDGVNTFKDQDVRKALNPFTQMMQRTGCAVIFVRHLNKNQEANAVNAGGGSIGIIGAARVALLLHPDPESVDGNGRIMAKIKSNLAHGVNAVPYTIEQDDDGRGVVKWAERAGVTAQAIMDVAAEKRQRGGKRREAREWLESFLAHGARPAEEAIEQALQVGIAEKTLRRALGDVGDSVKTGLEEGWFWKLREESVGF